MKKNLFVIFLLLIISNQSFSQERIVDPIKPIASYEFGYHPLNNNLIVTVLLNPIENTKEVPVKSSIKFNAAIEGIINWETFVEPASDRLLLGIASPAQGNNPFVYTIDIKTPRGALIFASPQSRAWKSIEKFKIKYDVNGKYEEFPTTTIYPPSVTKPSVSKLLKVESRAKIVGDNIGEISIESVPLVPFKLSKISIVKTKGNNISTSNVSIASGTYANNGKLNVPFTADIDLNDIGAIYTAEVTANEIGTDIPINSQVTRLVFVDSIPLSIRDKKPDFFFQIDDQNSLVETVNTSGNGNLGIKFLTKEFKDNIQTEIERSGSLHKIKISNLDRLPDDSFSLFYYVDNQREISGPHIISKRRPNVSDFKFNGTESDRISMRFRVPSYVQPGDMSISLSDTLGNALIASGNVLINKTLAGSPEGKCTINAKISNELANIIGGDTIRDIKFDILYRGKSIYSLGIKVFNQKILNSTIASLVSATAEKPSKRNKEEIQSILNAIVKIGASVGNSIQSKEVTEALDGLKNGDKEKVKSTMSDIGKWVVVVGKVVLDIII